MSRKQTFKQLAKFIVYILGRQPDEFGLVLDKEGYIKIKEFLKVLSEEEGWRYVRRSHINEILLTSPNPPVEIHDDRIRATDRKHLSTPIRAETLPKLLYTCVRSKAYPHVTERGISPMGYGQVILSDSRAMAERMGKRIDPSPIILTIHTEKSLTQNVRFNQCGQTLYLADRVPPGCFTGPPLPKQKIELKQKSEQSEKTDKAHQKLAGSFHVDLEKIKSKPYGKGKKKEIAWKKDRKRTKRGAQRKQQQ